jgi:hypothetical protein
MKRGFSTPARPSATVAAGRSSSPALRSSGPSPASLAPPRDPPPAQVSVADFLSQNSTLADQLLGSHFETAELSAPKRSKAKASGSSSSKRSGRLAASLASGLALFVLCLTLLILYCVSSQTRPRHSVLASHVTRTLGL